MDKLFFDTMMDNMIDGIYILDDKGNYIFVNSTYCEILNMPKSLLLTYNVHDFVYTGQIDQCISDIVYRERRQVIMFQDVLDTQKFGRDTYRQIVISTPIFDENGHIKNILAVVRPIDRINYVYDMASKSEALSTVQKAGMDYYREGKVVANSRLMRKVIETANMVVDVDVPVLITGDSGTGKEVIAQYIHQRSSRGKRNMVVVNCAALPEQLLEAELFGYVKGAFTGALSSGKRGLFEEADGSTLFLDEINSMPINLQGKILRAIETKSIQRVGSTELHKVDFRLISATNQDLRKMIGGKSFREDLYYRLAVVPIHLAPLHERKEDILPLSEYFLNVFCKKYSKEKELTNKTRQTILNYDWPGNVRELKNFIERSVVMSMSRFIEIDDVLSFIYSSESNNMKSVSAAAAEYVRISREHRTEEMNAMYESMLGDGISLNLFIKECEKGYIEYALSKYKNSYKAAKKLGTSQSAIMRRKKKYGIR